MLSLFLHTISVVPVYVYIVATTAGPEGWDLPHLAHPRHKCMNEKSISKTNTFLNSQLEKNPLSPKHFLIYINKLMWLLRI